MLVLSWLSPAPTPEQVHRLTYWTAWDANTVQQIQLEVTVKNDVNCEQSTPPEETGEKNRIQGSESLEIIQNQFVNQESYIDNTGSLFFHNRALI